MLFINSGEPLNLISEPGARCCGLVPLVMSTNLSPIGLSELDWAVESIVILSRRSRSTFNDTRTTRRGSLDPESSTKSTLPTPIPSTRTGEPDARPVASSR